MLSFSLMRFSIQKSADVLLSGDLFVKQNVCFFSGVITLFDQRSPAAHPPRPGLGASGSGALCGTGGFLTQQVDWHRSTAQLCRQLTLPRTSFHDSFSFKCFICCIFSYSGRCKQEEVEQKASQNPKGTVMLYR